MPDNRILLGSSPSLPYAVVMSGVVTARRIVTPRNISKHTAHPVMASFETGERWAWCYIDQMDLEVPKLVAPHLR